MDERHHGDPFYAKMTDVIYGPHHHHESPPAEYRRSAEDSDGATDADRQLPRHRHKAQRRVPAPSFKPVERERDEPVQRPEDRPPGWHSGGVKE